MPGHSSIVFLVVYLGFVNGGLISQAMFVGWSKNGIPWLAAAGLETERDEHDIERVSHSVYRQLISADTAVDHTATAAEPR